MTSFRARDFAFILEVMADLQPYRIEPERVPTPEDSKKRKGRSKRSVRRHILINSSAMRNHAKTKRIARGRKQNRRKIFTLITALVAVNGTIFFVNCFRYKKAIE